MSVLSQNSTASETVYYNQGAVRITDKIIRIRFTSYSLTHLASIKFRASESNRMVLLIRGGAIGGFIGVVLGAFLFLDALVPFVITMLLSAIIGVIIAMSRFKTSYSVVLSFSSHETDVITADNKKLIQRLYNILERTMIKHQ